MNIFDTVKTWPQDTWVIVGKGPSFRADVRELYPQAKILCINESSNFVAADLCMFNDHAVIHKFSLNSIEHTKVFACPIKSPWDANDNWATIALLSPNLSQIKDRLCFFDSNRADRFFAETTQYKPLTAYNSTYESALWFLAYSGVKKIYTTGIDFTSTYNPSFGERVTNVPFTAMKYYAQVCIDYYKLDVQTIPFLQENACGAV